MSKTKTRRRPTAKGYRFNAHSDDGFDVIETLLATSVADAVELIRARLAFTTAKWTVQLWILGIDGRAVRELRPREIWTRIGAAP